ncbi:transposase [Natronococcus jeotgali]|uniref:Transposase IS4 family protein n=1 Tax=Natronococcus jeotgali DSM 18795 TaxID=1227498 RepID=L9XKR3_9EURY|nr:transposase [Natronococcus jeotgali]ELY62157.1 transposase IS4 family protein [Natronococcus jeotgali DSM 18795]
MASTQASRRDVFRAIATDSYRKWPAYDTTGLYDRSSLGALEEDIQTIASAWFAHKAYDSIDEFICELPLKYVDLTPHDQYDEPATYEIRTLVRTFLLKEAYGWDHETALLEYLKDQPVIQQQLGFETLPDQSTFWRTWHCRFSPDLQETIQESARLLLINANRKGSDVPRDPLHDSESHEETSPTDHEVLAHADEITEQLSHIAYPAFSLNRGDSCEIHPNAFWALQTYLGLRENLAANEGARSFFYDPQRDRTPLGHPHRTHIRGLSLDSIHEMYHEALQRLINRVSETDVFHRAEVRELSRVRHDGIRRLSR